jgi:hypothetical protein
MLRDSAIEEGGDMVVKRELHTKCVTPRRLSRELKDLVGHDAQFKVEVIISKFVSTHGRFQLTIF